MTNHVLSFDSKRVWTVRGSDVGELGSGCYSIERTAEHVEGIVAGECSASPKSRRRVRDNYKSFRPPISGDGETVAGELTAASW